MMTGDYYRTGYVQDKHDHRSAVSAIVKPRCWAILLIAYSTITKREEMVVLLIKYLIKPHRYDNASFENHFSSAMQCTSPILN